jgi:hypothetical protein
MTTNEFPITREQFAAWLASKGETYPVGFANHCRSCPLATAINQPNIRILTASYSDEDPAQYYGTPPEYALPEWARSFAETVDKEFTDTTTGVGRIVRAADARRILESIS